MPGIFLNPLPDAFVPSSSPLFPPNPSSPESLPPPPPETPPLSLDFLIHPAETGSGPARRFPAWLIPAGIFAGFGLLFAGLYRDRLLPAPTVRVAPVLATGGTTPAPDPASSAAPAAQPAETSPVSPPNDPAPTPAGAPLFQASGWVEPDPWPVKAAALIDGVVAETLVREGQLVEKGDLLARLIDDDAKLALAAAEARHRLLESSRQAHLAGLEAARKKREAALAESAAVKTLADEAGQQMTRFDRLAKAGGVSELEAISTRLRLQREKSLHIAAIAREAELDAEVHRMEHETAAREAEAAAAAIAIQQARLTLDRTRIPSPVKGRILRIMAAPGDKKMLGMDHADSSTVCVLYDPDKLQARVDVPLADAARLRIGQPVRIHTGLLSDRSFTGEVTRITGEADIQRNTLQAKVRITAPADQLRPEMLCRVEFLAPPPPSSSSSASQRTGMPTDFSRQNNPAVPSGGTAAPAGTAVLWVPAAAVRQGIVWICDPETKRLTPRTVRPAGETRADHIRITDGLRPGELAVLTPGDWREGQRVHPQPLQP